MKYILIILTIILIVIVCYKWFNDTNEHFTDIVMQQNTTAPLAISSESQAISSTTAPQLSIADKILLVNSILTSIHQNFTEITDCTNYSSKCLTETDKQAILNAYKVSQEASIDQRYDIFTTLTKNYQNKYGDFDNIYWDFKIVDIMSNPTNNDYYYVIVKNIVVNRIYDYLKNNIKILPPEIISVYPNEVPKEVILSIVNDYFSLDPNSNSITFQGLDAGIANSVNNDSLSIPSSNSLPNSNTILNRTPNILQESFPTLISNITSVPQSTNITSVPQSTNISSEKQNISNSQKSNLIYQEITPNYIIDIFAKDSANSNISNDRLQNLATAGLNNLINSSSDSNQINRSTTQITTPTNQINRTTTQVTTNPQYNKTNNSQYNGTNIPQYNGANNSQYNGANNSQYNGANNSQYNGANSPQYNGANNSQYNGANSSQYNGANNSQYNGTNNLQYNEANNSQYNGTQYNAANNSQYNGANNSQYSGTNNSQYSGTNKSQYSGTNSPQYNGTNDSQYNGAAVNPQYNGAAANSQYNGAAVNPQYNGATANPQYNGTNNPQYNGANSPQYNDMQYNAANNSQYNGANSPQYNGTQYNGTNNPQYNATNNPQYNIANRNPNQYNSFMRK